MPQLGPQNNPVKNFKSFTSLLGVLRLGFVVLIGRHMISPCYCIPVETKVANTDPWWCQPCQQEHRTRHSRGINEPLKTQFTLAIGDYQNHILRYVDLLNDKLQIEKISKQQIKKNNWLPRKRFFRKLKKDNHQILPELHKNVQIFAVTFQRLLEMEIRTQDGWYDPSYRTDILTRVIADINMLRCEIEDEIANKLLPAPEKIPSDFVDKYIPTAVDGLAGGLIKDFSILNDYSNFIQKCFNKLIGKSKKNKSKKRDKQQNKQRTSKNKSNPKSERS